MTAAFAGGALVLGACSTTPGAQPTTTTTTTASSPSSTSTSTAGGSTTTSPTVSNLAVTDAIRSQLLAAGAAAEGAPVAQYNGLVTGLTYYALDRSTNTYWAAARLSPIITPGNQPPTQAEISSQDAGSYLVFSMPQGGAWKAYLAGNTGPNTPCPVTIPAGVLKVWGWAAGSCRPAGV
jgi:hypothetical protein